MRALDPAQDDAMPHEKQPIVGTELSQSLFPPPALLAGEKLSDFYCLLYQIRVTAKPRDVVDQAWAYDWACCLWESLRLRRLKNRFLNEAAHAGLVEILSGRTDGVVDLAAAWRRREALAMQKVQSLLEDASLSMEDVYAQATVLHLEAIERFDALIARADARRDTVWRALDQRRVETLRRLREIATTTLEEADVLSQSEETTS